MSIDPINDIKILQLMKIIKNKLFSPKNKVIQDEKTGLRSIVPGNRNNSDEISSDISELVEESDGWDVADKDFVKTRLDNFRNEVYQYISSIPTVYSGNKSTTSTSVSTSKKVPYISVLNSKGKLLKSREVVQFFNPAILLKECTLIDVSVISNNEFTGEFKLNLIEVNKEKPQKTTLFSIKKIQSNVAGLGGSENKIKFDKPKTIIFELEGPVTGNQYMLQISIEI